MRPLFIDIIVFVCVVLSVRMFMGIPTRYARALVNSHYVRLYSLLLNSLDGLMHRESCVCTRIFALVSALCQCQ